MARHLKRWESPRRAGRNDKGRGGSARQRQKRKQFQALRQKLKQQSEPPNGNSSNSSSSQKGEANLLPFFISEQIVNPSSSERNVSTRVGTIILLH